MMSRVAALAAALIVLSLVAPVAVATAGGAQAGVSAVDDSSTVAQTANNTTDQSTTEAESGDDWSPPGPFTLDELRSDGVQAADAPASVRYLGGESPDGAVALRYRPANPLENSLNFLKPGTTLNGDVVQIYSTVFGDATGEYEFVVVFWQEQQRTVNGSTVTYAADQEVQRAEIQIEDGYATADVRLQSHYEETHQATAWLEKDGEPVPGVRWRFAHASLPASQQVQINTRADAWWYAFRTAILPGVAGIILGLSGARLTLKQTGYPPGYGLGAWAIIGGIGVLAGLGGLYYEVAAVIANFDVVMGLSLGVIAYGGGLRMHSPTEKIAFERKELRDAQSLRGTPAEESQTATDGGEPASATDVVQIPDDGYKDELYEDLPILMSVRGDKGRHIVKKGLGPFLARLFGDGALLDLSALRTRVRVEKGGVDEKVFVDPDSEGVKHTPARLARRMPVWHRIDSEGADMVTKALYGALTVGVLSLPYIGYRVGEATIGAPLTGAAIGLVLLGIESLEALDGEVEFTPAPRHFLSADASLAVLQEEYSDAKTLEEYEEIAWNERSRTALEAREVESRRDKSITQRMNERALGMDLDVQNSPSDPSEDVLGGPQHGEEDQRTATDGGEDDE